MHPLHVVGAVLVVYTAILIASAFYIHVKVNRKK